MGKLNNVKLTITDVTGWHGDDIAVVTKWINAYANLLGQNMEEKAIRCIINALAFETSFPNHDITEWLQIVLSLIFYELIGIIQCSKSVNKEKLKCLKLSFSPITNPPATCFNNCFDMIDFNLERKAIISQAIMLLKE